MAHVKPGVLPLDRLLCANGNGEVERAPDFEAEETGRRDADNLEWLAVQCELTSDRARRAAEFTLPERVADDYAARPASPSVIGRSKDTSQNRRNAEDFEKIAAHPDASGRADLPALGEIERVFTPGEGARKRLLVIADVFPLWIGDRGVRTRKAARSAICVGDFHFGELIRTRYGKRPQSYGVEQLKDRRIGADAERERNHRHGCEAGRFSQEPKPVV